MTTCHRFWCSDFCSRSEPTAQYFDRATPPVLLTCLFESPRSNLLDRHHTQSGVCLMDKIDTQRPRASCLQTPCRIPPRKPLDGRGEAFYGLSTRAPDSVIKLALHPFQQAAAFVAYTRPPDFVPSRHTSPVFAPEPHLLATRCSSFWSSAANLARAALPGAQLNSEYRPYYQVSGRYMYWHDYAEIKLNCLVESLNKIGLVKRLKAQLRLWINTGTVNVNVSKPNTSSTGYNPSRQYFP
jgi:hypothetical protein